MYKNDGKIEIKETEKKVNAARMLIGIRLVLQENGIVKVGKMVFSFVYKH